MPYKRALSTLTTWHSQNGLLLISFTWGASYLVPERLRITFSEVFPTALAVGRLPMWCWGTVLVMAAAVAYLMDLRITRHPPPHRWAWPAAWGAHMMLAGTYITLSACALAEGVTQIHGPPTSVLFWGGVVSAASRPVLWGYIGYLHSTYARLPRSGC
jgi:hypothetical protein